MYLYIEYLHIPATEYNHYSENSTFTKKNTRNFFVIYLSDNVWAQPGPVPRYLLVTHVRNFDLL